MTLKEEKLPLTSYLEVYNFIKTLKYNDKDGIIFLEQQLYNLLQKLPDDINLLALLMREQIMNNRGQRARSIAYKIWESGGTLDPEIEQIYIDDLINLGLEDMAGGALTPYISDIENNVEKYHDLFLKYAVFSGNMSLLERVLNFLPDSGDYQILRYWLMLNNEEKVMGHIQPIMKRLNDNVLDGMLGFEYNLFMDRGFPDVEFVYYVDETITNYNELRDKMNLQISSYCAAHKIIDLLNLSCIVLPIEQKLI